MSKITMFTVTVLGWEKHNGNKKRGHTHFLLSTRFFDDAKIHSLPNCYKLAYIWILSRCGDDLKSTVSFSEVALRYAVSNLKVPIKCIEALQSNQLLRIDKIESLKELNRKEIEKNSPDEPKPSGLKAQTEMSFATKKPSFNFEEIYAIYPRKEGKADGMATLKKTIINETQLKELHLAVKNYTEDCKISNRERRYIRQWSSFIGSKEKPFWRDWIDWEPEVKQMPEYQTATCGFARDV